MDLVVCFVLKVFWDFWFEVFKVYYDSSVGGVYFGIEKVMVVMKFKYYWFRMY